MFRTVGGCAALLLLFTATATAQIDVTATGGTPAGAYPTLGAAFAAINAGVHTGEIRIDISGGTNETASAVLNGSGGTSSYTQITIRPAGGVARTVTGNLAGPLVDLNGADSVTIDGLNTGGNALSLVNTNTNGGAGSGSGPSALRFTNDATANRIRNLTLGGACGGNPSAQSGVIYFGSASVTGNDDNWITGCDIGPAGSSLPVNTVYALGNSTSAVLNNSGIVVSGNRIHDFSTASGGSTGITVLGGNADWTLSGNSFYQTAARTQTGGSGVTHYGIYVSNNLADANNFVIVDNTIGGSAPGAAGSPWSESGAFQVGFTGIYLSQGGTGGSIQNNTITNFTWSTNGDWRGIQIKRGTVAVGTLAGNTVGAGSGSGAITLTSGMTSRTAFGIDAAGVSGNVTVSNNTIGSITTLGTTANISTNITGILLEGNVVSVAGNTIGSPTTPNSLHASNASTSIVPQSVTGIASGNVGAVTIAENLIANLRNAYAGTAGGGQVRGIVITLGSSVVVGNTVRDLSGVAPLNSAGAGAAVVGIAQTSPVGDQDVSRNVVHSLSNTAASAIVNVVGIFYAGSASGTHRIAGNIVHSLSLTSTNYGSSLIGIQCTGGTATCQNNMVRLGLDSAGNPITAGYTIVGIVKATMQANRFYHNSVWIGGTGVGPSSSNTCAFRRAATGMDDVRDNIFINVRQNATTGGRHFALVLNAPVSVTSDCNIYQVAPGSPDLASLDGGATSISTLQALRGVPSYGQDVNSGVGDPRFVAPADPAATLSLKLRDPTAGEGSGVAIASVADDQEGESRGALTPADIGADAGLYSMSADTDIFTPHITYAPLDDTASRGDRTLTATLTDVAPAGDGVPADGSFRPRVWFKKATDAAWTFSNAGTLESGDGRDGVWSFIIRTTDLLPEEGDQIQYYLVAQDQATAPNLWYGPVAATDPIHLDVNTQLVPPSAPEHYTISASLYGTYYVPNDPGGQADRVFSSLTRAGGFFAALGGLPVSGDVTLVVNGNVLDEDGTHPLNPWQEVGEGNYTLTIRPDGPTTRVLSGTTVADGEPLIDIQGADHVVIDGRFAADGPYLILRNTSPSAADTGPTVRFDNGATHGVLRNCVVENNGSAVSRGAVVIGSTGANDDLQIISNDLRDATAGTMGAPANGICADAPGSSGITIADNRIYNWTGAGVMLSAIGGGVVVQGNSFYHNLPAPSATAQTAIFVGGVADGHAIAGNFIGGQAPLCDGSPWINTGHVAFHGIHLASTGLTTPSRIAGNTIRNIRMTGAGAASFTGIRVGGPSGPASVTGNWIGDHDYANRVEVAGDGATSGIHTEGDPAAAISVTNNTIANLVASGTGAGVTLKGIYHAAGIGTISDNDIHDLSSASSSADGGATSAVVGIFANLGHLPDTETDNVVERNTLRALRSVPAGAAATVVSGIVAGDGASFARGRAERNRIYDLTNASAAATPSIRGIRQASTSASWTLANNQIALTNAPLTNAVRVAGIYQDGPGACSYNSIYVGGSQDTGDGNSYAFGRYSAGSTVLRDNLLVNDRVCTGPATGNHCAIANLTLVWDGWSSDYDVLIVADPSRVGRFGSTYLDFNGWRAASGGEGGSLSESAGTIPVASLFVDAAAGDLDIRPTSGYDAPPIVSNVGIPLADQTTDYGGSDARGPIPDIGADEITIDRTLSVPGNLSPVSPTYPGNYDDLTVSGAGAPTLAGDVNVFGVLSLEGDNVVTQAHTMTIPAGGSVVRSSGHIVGNLRKHVPSGSGIDCSFEVGTGADYAPIDLHFDTVVVEGYLETTTLSGDHPELPTSTLDPERSVNRYWRIGNAGVGFGVADATLHFVPEDLDGGADTIGFRVGKYDALDWSLPTVGARTPTSIAATGLTSFSEFAVAELLGFTITATAGAGGAIDPSGAVPVGYGGSQSFAITPDLGYHITDVLADSVSVGPVPSYEFTNVTADHTIEANFAIDIFTLTTSVIGGGTLTIDPDLSSYAYGDSVTVTASPDSGWVFDHWTGDASGSDNPLLVIMEANKTITGVFVDALRPHDVAVIAPNGGEVWGIGSNQTIRWAAADDVGVTGIELEYSVDGGASFPYIIASDLPNTGSYLWVVPATPAQHARLRLTARDAVGNATVDTSDADFEISGGSQAIAESLLREREMIGVYPNPAFVGNARVLFRSAVGVRADIRIYDLSGRLTRTLGTGIVGGGGVQTLAWDGCDDRGDRVAEGIYLVRMMAGSMPPATRRLALLR